MALRKTKCFGNIEVRKSNHLLSFGDLSPSPLSGFSHLLKDNFGQGSCGIIRGFDSAHKFFLQTKDLGNPINDEKNPYDGSCT